MFSRNRTASSKKNAKARRTEQNRRRFRSQLEALEPRQMMAASFSASLLPDGTLKVTGTDASNSIAIVEERHVDGYSYRVAGATISTAAGNVASVSSTSVSRIEVDGRGGDDVIKVGQLKRSGAELGAWIGAGNPSPYIPALLVGGDGNDALTGGRGPDRLEGGSGLDTLTGGLGADVLDGGAGPEIDTFNDSDGSTLVLNRPTTKEPVPSSPLPLHDYDTKPAEGFNIDKFINAFRQTAKEFEVGKSKLGGLTPVQERNLRTLLGQINSDGSIRDIRWAAYMLATVLRETGNFSAQRTEIGWQSMPYGVPDPSTGQTYYGRGYIQITWKEGYADMDRMLQSKYANDPRFAGRSLVANPELALEPDVSYDILSMGLRTGFFNNIARTSNGRQWSGISDYINDGAPISEGLSRYHHARELVNYYETSSYAQIAANAERFEGLLHIAAGRFSPHEVEQAFDVLTAIDAQIPQLRTSVAEALSSEIWNQEVPVLRETLSDQFSMQNLVGLAFPRGDLHGPQEWSDIRNSLRDKSSAELRQIVDALFASIRTSLTQQGMQVQYLDIVPDANGDVLRVRYVNSTSVRTQFHVGGTTGFEYLDGKSSNNLSGDLTSRNGHVSLDLVWGIEKQGEELAPFINERSQVLAQGFSAQGRYIANFADGVRANGYLRAALGGWSQLSDGDADFKLRLSDFTSGQVRAIGDVIGTVMMDPVKFAISTPNGNMQWTGYFKANFAQGQITTEFSVDTPDLTQMREQLSRLLSAINDLRGELSDSLGELFSKERWNIDLPILEEALNDQDLDIFTLIANAFPSIDLELPAMGELQSPAELNELVERVLGEVKRELTAAGLTVEYIGLRPNDKQELLRVTYERAVEVPMDFNIGGETGFAYFDKEVNGAIAGQLQVASPKLRLHLTWGIEERNGTSNPFVGESSSLRLEGLGATAGFAGSMALRDLANVRASGKLRAHLEAGMQIVDNDADDKLRLEDLQTGNQFVAANVQGELALEDVQFVATVPILNEIRWSGAFHATFVDGHVETDFQLNAPDTMSIIRQVAAGIFDVLPNIPLFESISRGANSKLPLLDVNILDVIGMGDELKWLTTDYSVPDYANFDIQALRNSLNDLLSSDYVQVNLLPGANSLADAVQMIDNLIHGEKVNLLTIDSSAGGEWSTNYQLLEMVFPIPPTPITVNFGLGVRPFVGWQYHVGAGFDTTGFYVSHDTSASIYGGVEVYGEGTVAVAGIFDLATLHAGLGFKLEAGVRFNDPDPTDGAIYFDEIASDLGQSLGVFARADLFGRVSAELNIPLFWPLDDITIPIFDTSFEMAALWDTFEDKELAQSFRTHAIRARNPFDDYSIRRESDGSQTLVLQGTGANDSLRISGRGGDVNLTWFGRGNAKINNIDRVEFHGGAGDDRFDVSGDFDRPVVAYGDAGDDYLSGGSASNTLDGGDGNDRLRGGRGNDVLTGGSGDDKILGLFGDDILRGGDGNDDLHAGEGNDVVYGEAGNDRLDGEAGDDYLDGAAGNDAIRGGAGNDKLLGGDNQDMLNGGLGDDELYGQAGDDALEGGTGNDVLHGNNGVDILQGNDGNDTLYGEDGNDVLHGGTGSDQLYGGTGNDQLNGEQGADKVYGESGEDVILLDIRSGVQSDEDYYSGGADLDTIAASGTTQNDWITISQIDPYKLVAKSFDPTTGRLIGSISFGAPELDPKTHDSDIERMGVFGRTGNDRIVVDPSVTRNLLIDGDDGDDELTGGAGRDLMIGGRGRDIVYGGGNNDEIHGGEGDDQLFGDTGDDRIYGDEGADELDGGEGSDLQYGGSGKDLLKAGGGISGDMLYGGGGNDTLLGGDGMDVLAGNDGNDILRGGNLGDLLDGGAGDDQLFGEKGRDFLLGQSGNDQLWASDELGTADTANQNWRVLYRKMLDREVQIVDEQDELERLLEDPSVTADRRASLLSQDASLQNELAIINQQETDLLPNQTVVVDILDGGDNDDEIHGSAYHDKLSGGSGNDKIFQSAGNDSIFGGEGQDEFVILGTEDDDLIRFSLVDTAGGRVVGYYVNNLQVGTLEELDIEVATVDARGGNDQFTINFGNLAVKQVHAIGGTGNDVLDARGCQAAVVLDGGDGEDTLYGGDADDILRGGAGNDLLGFTRGADQFFGGEGVDELTYGTTDASELVSLLPTSGQSPNEYELKVGVNASPATSSMLRVGSWKLDADLEIVTIDAAGGDDGVEVRVHNPASQAINIKGGAGNDYVIAGQDFGHVDGGDGSDTLKILGTAENDSLDMTFSLSGTGETRIAIDRSINGGNVVHQELTLNTENCLVLLQRGADAMKLRGTWKPEFDISVEGDEGDDSVVVERTGTVGGGLHVNGGAGSDVLDARNSTLPVDLRGAEGHDTIYGGQGDDNLEGNDGDDRIVGGNGKDTVTGGAGSDVIRTAGDGVVDVIKDTTSLGNSDGNDWYLLGKEDPGETRDFSPNDQLTWLNGGWWLQGLQTSITGGDSGGQYGLGWMQVTNQYGKTTIVDFTSATEFVARAGDGWSAVTGRLSVNGPFMSIQWNNGSQWTRLALAGNWSINGRACSIREDGDTFFFTNENGGTATGYFYGIIWGRPFVRTSWGVDGELQYVNGTVYIHWSNGTLWTSDAKPSFI